MAKGRAEAEAPAVEDYMSDKYAGVEASVHATWLPKAPLLRVVIASLEKISSESAPQDIVNATQRAIHAHLHRPVKAWRPQLTLNEGDIVEVADGEQYVVTAGGQTGSAFRAKDDNQVGYEPVPKDEEEAEKAE